MSTNKEQQTGEGHDGLSVLPSSLLFEVILLTEHLSILVCDQG